MPHRILDSCYYLHSVLNCFPILVNLSLHLTQTARLVVAYLALRNWTRNKLDSRYTRLNFVKMEQQSYMDSLMIVVRSTLVGVNCRC